MALSEKSISDEREQRGFYTPTEDVIETLPDGRQIVVARAGVPMTVGEAERYGLVGDKREPIGTIQTPVGNTLLTEEVEKSTDISPQLQASIDEVEKVQKGVKSEENSEEKAKTPTANKAKKPTENK